MISIQSAVQVLLSLVVAGLIFYLLWWLLKVVALPQPFDKVARIVLAVLAVFVIISLLLTFTGHRIFVP